MAKIVISDLHPLDAKTFLHDLDLEEIDAVSGNGLVPGDNDSSNLQLTTIQDGVNNTSYKSGSLFNISDNKFFTLDFSRLTVYFII
ncbi:hypothetical protein NIES4103_63390 [Nostoc sp. NIES-4103]|nr:hypothetical protein NIES4103_63390 [Nostoc sp. NIES-4103]